MAYVGIPLYASIKMQAEEKECKHEKLRVGRVGNEKPVIGQSSGGIALAFLKEMTRSTRGSIRQQSCRTRQKNAGEKFLGNADSGRAISRVQ